MLHQGNRLGWFADLTSSAGILPVIFDIEAWSRRDAGAAKTIVSTP